MNVEFEDEDLARLESDAGFNGGHGLAVVRAFRKRIQAIRAAVDERDFLAFRSWNFEKRQGNRSHQHSIRLNDQWRLIVQIISCTPKNTVRVIEIVDYH